MSPSWRDRLLIGLAPDRVALVEMQRGLRPCLGVTGVRSCDETDGIAWEAALGRLGDMVERVPHVGSGAAHVILSNEFVRYVHVPWTPGIHAEKDRLALAADCFRAIHGEATDNWRIILDPPKYGRGSLAAAVDRALPERLREVLAKRRWRLASLRPHLSAAFDLWRPRLRKSDGCFAVVEPGCVTALFRRGDEWVTVDNRRFRHGSSTKAALTLKQCVDTDRLQGGEGAVALVAPGMLPGTQGSADRPLRRLKAFAGPFPEDPWRAMAWIAA